MKRNEDFWTDVMVICLIVIILTIFYLWIIKLSKEIKDEETTPATISAMAYSNDCDNYLHCQM